MKVSNEKNIIIEGNNVKIRKGGNSFENSWASMFDQAYEYFYKKYFGEDFTLTEYQSEAVKNILDISPSPDPEEYIIYKFR